MKIFDEIYEYVNNVYGIDIKEKTRKRDYSEGRALFYFIARKKTNFTYECIGDYMGKDHASVLHAIKNTIHYLDKEIIAEALEHFGLVDVAPRDTIAYLKSKTKQLSEQLILKQSALSLLPQLESVYLKSQSLDKEKKERLNKRNTFFFEEIHKNLNQIEYNIEQFNEYE